MPAPLVDFSSPIIAAYQAGKMERMAREKFLAERKEKQQQFALAEKRLQAEQKKFDAQLKATSEFHKATLAHGQAQLDLQAAANAAKAAHDRAVGKLALGEAVSKGQLNWPTEQISTSSDYNPESLTTGQELLPPDADRTMEAPLPTFDIGGGISLNRNEMPPVYGPQQVRADMFKQMEASKEADAMREAARLENQNSRDEANREFQANEHRLTREAMLAATQIRSAGKAPNDTFVESAVRGQIIPTPTQVEKYSGKFRDYDWTEYNKTHPDDPSYGYIPHGTREHKELQEASQSKLAVQFGFDYAQALDDWLKGSNKQVYVQKGTTAFDEVVRLSRNVEKFIPGLKQGAALGVLGQRDMDLLRANLPDVTGALSERVFRNQMAKNAQSNLSWGMQRAIELAKKYQVNVNSVLGDVPAGQRDYEINKKYRLNLELRPEHGKLLGW